MKWSALMFLLLVVPQFSMAGFEERFEDADLGSRGWYDNTNPILVSAETFPGSNYFVEFRFPSGATKPINGGPMRRAFSETDTVYIRYHVKYSDNWEGSNRNYHPHEFMLLTNQDGRWTGPAYTHLTAYVEQNALRPMLAIQDGRNIDMDNINADLVGITENRSVAGCNGTINKGYDSISCYPAGSGMYWNGTSWRAGSPVINAGSWHKVEAYFKLNSITDGKGVADGVMKYWLDDELIINQSNVMFRTGKHPDMKFNQLVIAPWIGDGSPVDQTFWIGNVKVATSMPEGAEDYIIKRPTNLRAISTMQ